MKYLRKFEHIEDFNQFVESGLIERPNVSYIVEGNIVNYFPQISPSFIVLDQTIDDPYSMITGDINGKHLQLIRNNCHRYLGKNTGEGVMTICQLDDTNSLLYVDGTTADLTGNDGDVFMKLPRFAYKAEEIEDDKWKIGFVYGDAIDSTWKQWQGDELIGVYKGVNIDSKLYSHSDVFGSTGSQSLITTCAHNRGEGFSATKLKHHNILAFLFYAMYGNTNSQAIVGVGTGSQKQSGQTNALGMCDTSADTNGNLQSINFLGLENWWGDTYEWLDNITVNYYSWDITEDDGTTRRVVAPSINSGHISKIHVGENLDVIPKEANSSQTTGFCDLYYAISSTGKAVCRGGSANSLDGGIACVNAYTSATSGSRAGRLAFRGIIKEEKNVEAFKSLTVI